MKKKIIIWVSVIILVLILTPLVVFIIMSYQHGSAEPIKKFADKFQPSSSWTLVDERITPPREVCLDGHCPEVLRSWKSDDDLTYSQLQAMLRDAGWNFSIKGDCKVKTDVDEYASFCHAEGIADGYSVRVDYDTGSARNNKPTLNITISEYVK